jgi:hypothetical protein
MSDTQWWYEKNGQPAGPIPIATLQQLASAGDLKPATLVWTAGMQGWARAETVALLSFAPQPPPLGTPASTDAQRPPPPLDVTPAEPATADAEPLETTPFASPSSSGPQRPDPFAASRGAGSGSSASAGGGAGASTAPMNWVPQPRPATAAGAVAEPEELNVATTLLLAVVTFGIFGAIRFFQTARAYERLAGRETRFQLYFWIWVGCFLLAFPSHVPFLLGPIALVFQFLTLGEALRARREAMARYQLTPAVASENTHWLYLALGTLLAPLLVGLVFLVLQAMKWFEDWNAIRRAAIARG